MDASLNIVEFIENNPITKLTGTYQNKLVTKIKENFTDNEQQMFVGSFYCFLKYDRKKDFVIDLDDVWKRLGFYKKVKAKILLENHFNIDIDYKILLSHTGEQKVHTRGGHNKEKIMLNIEKKISVFRTLHFAGHFSNHHSFLRHHIWCKNYDTYCIFIIP